MKCHNVHWAAGFKVSACCFALFCLHRGSQCAHKLFSTAANPRPHNLLSNPLKNSVSFLRIQKTVNMNRRWISFCVFNVTQRAGAITVHVSAGLVPPIVCWVFPQLSSIFSFPLSRSSSSVNSRLTSELAALGGLHVISTSPGDCHYVSRTRRHLRLHCCRAANRRCSPRALRYIAVVSAKACLFTDSDQFAKLLIRIVAHLLIHISK